MAPFTHQRRPAPPEPPPDPLGAPEAAERVFLHYESRESAGRVLVDWLRPLAGDDAVVVAIAGGGVVVAAEVARGLGLPLDVLCVHPFAAPDDPALELGAVAEDGTVVLDTERVLEQRVGWDVLARVVARERSAAMQQALICSAGRNAVPVAARTAIIVDDGVETGLAAAAAVRAIRRLAPRRILVAAPIASATAVRQLSRDADLVIAPVTPHTVTAREDWYRSTRPWSARP